ncbi:MAG: RNA pyrophosphohydrolase [Hellea sp.]|nr:RNA pyrophosphohydrolase [Hellea sp.]
MSYRPAVGAAIFNKDGHIWLGKRYGQNDLFNWQMPQGGIDKGETPEFAVKREIYEETGISKNSIIKIGEIDEWLYYNIPFRLQKNDIVSRWIGQKQRWFAFRFHGEDKEINLKIQDEQEFSEWKWMPLSEIESKVIPFKRATYNRIAKDFMRYSKI